MVLSGEGDSRVGKSNDVGKVEHQCQDDDGDEAMALCERSMRKKAKDVCYAREPEFQY